MRPFGNEPSHPSRSDRPLSTPLTASSLSSFPSSMNTMFSSSGSFSVESSILDSRPTMTILSMVDETSDEILDKLEQAGRVPSKEKFRRMACNTFIYTGACPYNDRCVFLHDYRVKTEGAKVRTTRQTKINSNVKDTFYWPDMIRKDVSKHLDAQGLPTANQMYMIPESFKLNVHNFHNRGLYSMWMHFVEYCIHNNVLTAKCHLDVSDEPFFDMSNYRDNPHIPQAKRLSVFIHLSMTSPSHRAINRYQDSRSKRMTSAGLLDAVASISKTDVSQQMSSYMLRDEAKDSVSSDSVSLGQNSSRPSRGFGSNANMMGSDFNLNRTAQQSQQLQQCNDNTMSGFTNTDQDMRPSQYMQQQNVSMQSNNMPSTILSSLNRVSHVTNNFLHHPQPQAQYQPQQQQQYYSMSSLQSLTEDLYDNSPYQPQNQPKYPNIQRQDTPQQYNGAKQHMTFDVDGRYHEDHNKFQLDLDDSMVGLDSSYTAGISTSTSLGDRNSSNYNKNQDYQMQQVGHKNNDNQKDGEEADNDSDQLHWMSQGGALSNTISLWSPYDYHHNNYNHHHNNDEVDYELSPTPADNTTTASIRQKEPAVRNVQSLFQPLEEDIVSSESFYRSSYEGKEGESLLPAYDNSDESYVAYISNVIHTSTTHQYHLQEHATSHNIGSRSPTDIISLLDHEASDHED